MSKRHLTLIVLCLLMVGACASPTATTPPTATPPPSPVAEKTQVMANTPLSSSTAQMAPSTTAASTTDAQIPSFTPTTLPTNTPSPSPTPTTLPTDSPSPTPLPTTPSPTATATPDLPLLDVALSPNSASVDRYAKFEVTFNLPTPYDNPYDPAQVAVQGRFLTPDGTVETMPGFYYEDVKQFPDQYDKYQVDPGSGVWKVRYAPRQTGDYTFRVELTDAKGLRGTPWQTFPVMPSDHPGTLRIDPNHPTRFILDDGTPFVAMGTNLSYLNDFRLYEDMLANLHKRGGNFARVWVDPHWAEFLLEWQDGLTRYTDNGPTTFEGLGRYNQEGAWRLDRLFKWAEASDIYIMLTVWNWLAYREQWESNPYNSVNGGPLSEPPEVWSNNQVAEAQRNLLRYIVARWGYSSRLGILEFWNEADQANLYHAPTHRQDLVAWHNAMHDYVQTLFPDGRLTTTSFAWTDHVGQEHQTLWPELDLLVVNTHRYGGPEDLLSFWGNQFGITGAQGRPFFFGEYSLEAEASASQDPHGHFFHLGLWMPTFLYGASGVNMLWKYDRRFELPQLHAARLRAFSDFLSPELPTLTEMEHVGDLDAGAGVRAGGYLGTNRALVWCYNEAAFWTQPDDAIAEVMDAKLTLPLTDGAYIVEFWNPETGEVLFTTEAQAQNSTLTLTLPPFRRDLALKVYRKP